MATDRTISSRGSSLHSNRTVLSRQTYTGRQSRNSLSGIGPLLRSEGPSFFESVSNVGIYGGRFSAQEAPRASVTVNITHGAAPERNYGRNDDRQGDSNSTRQDGSLVPPSNSNQQQGQESPLRPVKRSNTLYELHLRRKGRGHPLWIPQPNLRLPISYRRTGVCIGDVGIITPDGAFDFLFNICLDANIPIHAEGLPEIFSSLEPPLSHTDIREFREFTYGSYLASSSVVRVQSHHQDARALAFESSASEGAILTMPSGAYVQELNNISKFREYVRVHAENWYRFANGPRGREVKNGDLRLVVGCDKSTSWGIAVFSNFSQQTNFHLEFNGRVDEHGRIAPGSLYDWEHSGTAEVRVGPDPEDNDELTFPGGPSARSLKNQCLFVRTLNVTLSDALWMKNFPNSAVPVRKSPKPYMSASTRASRLPRLSSLSEKKDKSTSTYQNMVGPGTAHELLSITEFGTNHSSEVIMTSSPLFQSTNHPAEILGDFLFKQFPDAQMAITHDRTWLLPLQKIPLTFSPVELITHICEGNVMRFENGVAYFEPKEDTPHTSPHIMQFSHLIDGHISVKEYLFGPEDPTILLDCISRLMEHFYIDDIPLKARVEPNGPIRSFADLYDTLGAILQETLDGTLDVIYREEEGRHALPPELPGHPHFFLPLSRVSIIANKRRQDETFDHVSDAIASERIETLRSQLNEILSQPPDYSNLIMPGTVEVLQRLAGALYRRYLSIREKEDLDEAICYYRKIITSSQTTSCSYLEGLLGLSASLYQRIILRGMFEDLVDLVQTLRLEDVLDLTTLLDPIIDYLRDSSQTAPFPFSVEGSATTYVGSAAASSVKNMLPTPNKTEDPVAVHPKILQQWTPGGNLDNSPHYSKFTPKRHRSLIVKQPDIPDIASSDHKTSVLQRFLQEVTLSRRRSSSSHSSLKFVQ